MKKVLFLGNSFTFYHDMPAMVQNLCNYDRDNIHAVKLTYGGYRLAQYLEEGTEPNRRLTAFLDNESWDYVVLHDQSCTPTVAPETFFSAAKTLCGRIRKNGAKPVFYATWAYKNRVGKQSRLAELGLTYEQFYRAQREAYDKAARDNDADIVRVVDAFRLAESRGAYDLTIRQQDDYHPRYGGSYLAALLFADYFLGGLPDPLWTPSRVDLSAEDAEKLVEIAREYLGQKSE